MSKLIYCVFLWIDDIRISFHGVYDSLKSVEKSLDETSEFLLLVKKINHCNDGELYHYIRINNKWVKDKRYIDEIRKSPIHYHDDSWVDHNDSWVDQELPDISDGKLYILFNSIHVGNAIMIAFPNIYDSHKKARDHVLSSIYETYCYVMIIVDMNSSKPLVKFYRKEKIYGSWYQDESNLKTIIESNWLLI